MVWLSIPTSLRLCRVRRRRFLSQTEHYYKVHLTMSKQSAECNLCPVFVFFTVIFLNIHLNTFSLGIHSPAWLISSSFFPWPYWCSLCIRYRNLSLRPLVCDSVKQFHKFHVCSSVAAALRKYQRNNDSTRAFQTAESVGEDNSETLKSIYYNHNNNYSIDFMALYILASYFTFITAVASSRSPVKQSK